MNRAIKLTNNNYLDSTGIIHNKKKLSELLNSKEFQNQVTVETNLGYFKLFSFKAYAWGNNPYVEFTVIGVNNLKGICKGFIGINCAANTIPAWNSIFYEIGTLPVYAYFEDNTISVYVKASNDWAKAGLVINSSNVNITKYSDVIVETPTGTEITKTQLS